MSKIYYKSLEEIELIRESSMLVSKTLAEVAKVIKAGMTTIQLEENLLRPMKPESAKDRQPTLGP